MNFAHFEFQSFSSFGVLNRVIGSWESTRKFFSNITFLSKYKFFSLPDDITISPTNKMLKTFLIFTYDFGKIKSVTVRIN